MMSSAEDEEEVWFDVLVRQPDQIDMHQRARESRLPEPTELVTSTYARPGHKDEIKLVLHGFHVDSEQTLFSSGLSIWDASEHLCNYLLTDEEMITYLKKEYPRRVLELGSGLGRCGLLLHRLIIANYHPVISVASTVLTDGDINTLQLLRKNMIQNTSDDDEIISCQQLQWGKKEARDFLSQQEFDGKYDIIVGSDLIYTNRLNIQPLFETVAELLDRRGKFVLAHSEEHSVSVSDVINGAAQNDLFCEVLKQAGPIYLLLFKYSCPYSVNYVLKRLQSKIRVLEDENRALKSSKAHVERKCMKLDERCRTLRGDEALPSCILLSLDEDNFACIASFLVPQDFAHLACTCKHFGAKKHTVCDELMSLMQMVAHSLYESSSHREKEALRVYQSGESPFVFYEELLELRTPLKFDRLFGRTWAVEHAAGDQSTIVKRKAIAGRRVKVPSFRRYFYAGTAVSDYVMRTGKHFVTFTCPVVGSLTLGEEDYLWFGLVRPLRKFDYHGNIFTPFCYHLAHKLLQLHIEQLTPEWGEIHCCAYAAESGQVKWTDWGFSDNEGDNNDGDSDEDDGDRDEDGDDSFHVQNWSGMESFNGGTIGLLLDYEEGTLTVFKNGIKLGIMKEGLSGEYSWFVTVGSWFNGYHHGIKIERCTTPLFDSHTGKGEM